ncbi:hypothetical protein Tco_1444178, partial [Tanacetum coccineum]
GKCCVKNYSSMRRYIADLDNAYPKRSITKLILKGAVIFDVVSYQFRCALNYSKLIPPFYGFTSPNGEAPMFPIMYRMFVPELFPPQQGPKQTNHEACLYAVSTFPNSFMGPIVGYPSNALIPFTYNGPTFLTVSFVLSEFLVPLNCRQFL